MFLQYCTIGSVLGCVRDVLNFNTVSYKYFTHELKAMEKAAYNGYLLRNFHKAEKKLLH